MIKLESGKTYLTRDGRKAKVIRDDGHLFHVEIIGDTYSVHFAQPDGFMQPKEILGGRKETSNDLVMETV